MGYKTFSNQGTSLTQDEMNAEAERILSRVFAEIPDSLSSNAKSFVLRKKADLMRRGHVTVSIKELWWLRDLAG